MPLAAVVAALFIVLPVAHTTGLRTVLAFVVLAWALVALLRERHLPPLALPMSGWLALGAASALWSTGPVETFKAALYEIALPAGAFYAACLVSQRAAAYRLLCGAVICAPVVLAALMLIAYAHGGSTEPTLTEGNGKFRYYPGAGITSTLCIYALPFALLLARDASRGARVLGGLGLAAIAIAGVASDNRVFWPAVVAVMALFFLWQWRVFTPRQRAWSVAALVLSTAFAAGMFVHLNAMRGEPLEVLGEDNRPEAWRQWGRIAAQAPFVGHGLGLKNLRAVAEEKLPPQFGKRYPEMRFHAHNLPLDIVVQTGLAGLALFVALLWALARQAWRSSGDPERRALGAALLALIVGMLVKNTTDDFMHHAIVIAFWGYAGVLVGRLLAEGVLASRFSSRVQASATASTPISATSRT